MQDLAIIETLLDSTLRSSPPIIFAGLGALLSFKIGMMNMGLEGMMLIGAFTAVITSYFTGSAWLGLLAAMLLGGIMGFLFAFFNLTFKANNVVTSVAVNILALGLTTYLLRILFNVRGAFSSPQIVGLPIYKIPLIESVPLIKTLSGQSVTVYLSFLAVIAVHFVIYKTPIGLRVRATGIHEGAVETAGVKVNRLKFNVIICSGLLAGLGGAHLSLGQLTMFTENMTNSRGFIAIAASIFGQRTPIGTFIASLIFGFADALTMQLQMINLPPQLFQMIPYILTIFLLTVVALRQRRDLM